MPVMPMVKLWLIVTTRVYDYWRRLDWDEVAWLLVVAVGLPRAHWVAWLVVYGLLVAGWVDHDRFSVVASVGVVTVYWWFL
jgi:hypothetical protein